MLAAMRTQLAVIVTAMFLSFAASCDRKAAPPAGKLGDLSTSLDPAREAFNAREGQPRFLTLLSPT